MLTTTRRAVRSLAAATVLAAAVTGCAGGGATPDGEGQAGVSASPEVAADRPGRAEALPDGEAASPAAPAAPAPEQLAGLLSTEVPAVGDGVLNVVPGVSSAPADGDLWQVRVAVEGGLAIDPVPFADFVMATLNDPRGWSNEGFTFARTDTDDYDVEVVLASPDTSAELCGPLMTYGKLSCRSGDQAIITLFRWVGGTPDYAADMTGYRQYVIQHEVGHALGKGHVSCPGAGQQAPLMMQQTKGLGGCVPNAWPYP